MPARNIDWDEYVDNELQANRVSWPKRLSSQISSGIGEQYWYLIRSEDDNGRPFVEIWDDKFLCDMFCADDFNMFLPSGVFGQVIAYPD
jgi:hypothetical protein